MNIKVLSYLLCAPSMLILPGCYTPGMPHGTGRHIEPVASSPASIPNPVAAAPTLPRPQASPRIETFSVVVSGLPVVDLLFALSRDARINLDIHSGVEGSITINAINQTLPQILERISKQVDIRWTLENGTLSVEPDTPILKTYRIDYFNLARNVKTSVNIANSVASVGSGSTASGNNSNTEIASASNNEFWKTLEKNLRDLIQDEDKLVVKTVREGSNKLSSSNKGKMSTAQAVAAMLNTLTSEGNRNSQSDSTAENKDDSALKEGREANHVIINAESGTIVVRATQRKQEKVAAFLAQVGASAQRQVMIEATVVEVTLSDQYQAGVDWTGTTKSGNWGFGQSLTGSKMSTTGSIGVVTYSSNQFNATISFLEQFGRTKVLSSPKVMALNNQTAVMKVVDEQVYFGLKIEEEKNDSGVVTSRTFTSELHTVPVGLVLQVTPQIGESGSTTLNVRPTITNIRSYVEDPAVAIVSAQGNLGVKSLIPNLQVREFDSTLKIPSGQVAVLGGLIQDIQSNDRIGVPGLSRMPLIGDFFSYRDDTVKKIELVIFLRPVMVKEGGLENELAAYKQFSPDKDFFQRPQDHDLSAFSSGNLPLPESKPGSNAASQPEPARQPRRRREDAR